MSELQKKSLMKAIRDLCIFVVACSIIYFSFRSETFAVLFWGMAIITLIVFMVYAFISDCLFDWKLKGIFTETEYEEYQECYRMFGWLHDGKYMPNEQEINMLLNQHNMDQVGKEALISMKNKLDDYMNEVKK